MSANDRTPAGGGHTRWTRFRLLAQVGLMLLLALVAVVLIIQIADRAELRLRRDLTVDSSNSLDTATLELLRKLPREVEVDVFYRSPQPPLGRAFNDALLSARDLLTIAAEQAPGKFFVNDVDLADLEATEARLEELGIDRSRLFFQTVYGEVLAALVLRSGERHTVLRLVPDMGRLAIPRPDPSQPRAVARLEDWRGEEALAEALGRISSDTAPRVLFSTGAGELDPNLPNESQFAAVRLGRALLDEGFALGTWDPDLESEVPSDCAVLVIAAPAEPLKEQALDAVRAYLEQGGRLLVAMGRAYREPEQDGLTRLLVPYGIYPQRGVVCEVVFDPLTGRPMDGEPEVAQLTLSGRQSMSANHPATKPMWERDRSVRLHLSRSFERRDIGQPGGILLEVLRSSESSWLDLPGADGRPDFRFDPGSEAGGAFHLALAAEFQAKPGSANTAGKLVALAGPSLLYDAYHNYNRDLVLNLINYLADRDFRVRVAARDPFRSRLDLNGSPAATQVAWVAGGLLPGLALLCGVLLFWRRRRD